MTGYVEALIWAIALVILGVFGYLAWRRDGVVRNLLSAPKPSVGDRKWALTLYVLHRVWMTAVVEFVIYLLAVRYLGFDARTLIEIIKECNAVFLLGTGGAVAIYTTGNVGEWRYRSGGYGTYGPAGYGGPGIGPGIASGANPDNIPETNKVPPGVPVNANVPGKFKE